mgnify:CR=1
MERGPDQFGPTKRDGALIVAASLGSAIAGPIVLGVAAGLWLDKRFEGGGFFLMGTVALGIAGAVVAGYRLVKPYL